MRTLLLLPLLCLTLGAGEIRIAVAANVGNAVEELKAAFAKAHPGIRVQATLGSSGKLAAQIRNGAPYQLFMAADMHYPQALQRAGLGGSEPVVYARGMLACVSKKPRDFSRGLVFLKEPSVQKIAIANPKTAPYGKAAAEALHSAGLFAVAEPKFIYGESVAQTAAYVLTAADVGFVARSSLEAPAMQRFKEGTHWVAVDPALYTPMEQGMVILKNGEGNGEVRAFYDFILGETGRAILRRYGYGVE